MVITHIPESRWSIVCEIAKKSQSPTELAKKLTLSVPYVHQQLTLLDAQGIVSRTTVRDGSPGKPKQIYKIVRDIVNLKILTNGYAGDSEITDDVHTINYLELLTKTPKHAHCIISKYYWDNVEYFLKTLAIGHISSDEDKIELITITTNDHLDELRSKISNVKIKDIDGKHKTIACWVHTEQECIDGIKKKDNYYLSHIAKVTGIIDRTEIFKKLKKMMK